MQHRQDGHHAAMGAGSPEKAAHDGSPAVYRLVLYVAGSAPRSLRAVAAVRKLCQEYLPGCHSLEVVDIYQQPALAEEAGILAVPLLIKQEPPPEQKFVGDMSNLEAIINSLRLPHPAGNSGRSERP